MAYRNLEAELKRKGMTKGDLARMLYLSPSTLSCKFNGKSKFAYDEAVRVKSILDIEMPIEELFENTDETASA